MRKNLLIVFSIIISVGFAQRSIVQQFSETFANVAEKVNPAVVTISTDKIISLRSSILPPLKPYFGFCRKVCFMICFT